MKNIEIAESLLQVVSSLALLVSKFFLRSKDPGKKLAGWIVSFFGTSTWMGYIYCLVVIYPKSNFWILITYGIATIFLYVYALSSYSDGKYAGELKKWDFTIKKLISLFTIIVCIVIIVRAHSLNTNMGLQVLIVVSGLIGTLMLAMNTQRSIIFGWVSYTVSHLASVKFMYPIKDSWVFVVVQSLSAILAVYTIVQLLTKKEKT